jgi:hypothetical protein
MAEPTRQHTEKVKVLKKLIRQWMAARDTQDKAQIVLSQNPQIKRPRKKAS